MARINYSDNIDARGRKLYLQTNNLEEERKIVSTLFDGGRVLAKEESFYESELSVEELGKRAEKYHSERVADIGRLYAISARVKTVRHPLSLNKLGRQFLKWNLLDEAISEFELAIQYDSRYGEVYTNLGEAYLRRGGVEEAVEILEKGIHVVLSYADVWQKLGTAYLRNNQHQKAITAFRRALEINPSYDEPHFSIALCLIDVLVNGIQKKDFPDDTRIRKQVQEHLSRAVALSSRFRTSEFEEAMREFRRGRISEAQELLQRIGRELPKVVDLDFDDAFYLNYLYGERGRSGKAVQEYVDRLEALIKEYPKFPDLHNKLGIGYLVQCRHLFNRALHQFQSACEINPEYERAKRNLKLAKNDGKGLILLLRAMLK